MSVLREPDAEPIPGYRLIEPLGSGGFGEVWKCEAPGGLFKAIKFVFGNLNSLDVDGARAEQERQALNRIKEIRHPFVLPMDRIEIIEGELLIVMELADKNLHDHFVECQSAGLVGIPRDDLLRYLRDAAEALDYMTERNLVHLDVKPRNLFLLSDHVKVADFGLVKHLERTGPSGILGGVTPLYAPPETFAGKVSDRSDQYSLAIVYQELLTSQRPFAGKNARMLAQQHMHEPPELRSLPEAERPVVARSLAKDPSQRFPSCLAFIKALYNCRVPQSRSAGSESGRPGRGRPKSMADTMEDMQLAHFCHDEPDIARMPERGGAQDEDVDFSSDEPDPRLEEASALGLTAALPQTGTLRPTLILGLGSLGKRALMELRCRLLDRFGDLSKVPLLRFLYIDTDRESLQEAQRGAPEVALTPTEVYHLPLQAMAHYRRRQLEQIAEWMPREKLYALPRSLQTQGIRALGRLAFTDNYMRFVARLKRDLAAACHPDALYQSVSNTGLALRDNTPRVTVLASATGGASGYLVDLAYTLRRLLRQQRQENGRLSAVLFCGAPDDPATPGHELANLYASLTEINHYTEGVTSFSAQYGTDGQRQVEQGAPYDTVYLLTQKERTPDARRDVLAHAGSYLFHEFITPLGARLERMRHDVSAARWGGTNQVFRTFGTHGVWFPRGLLLRLAARRAVGTLVEQWALDEEGSQHQELPRPGLGLDPRVGLRGLTSEPGLLIPGAEVEAACDRVLADPHLQPGSLTLRMEEVAARYLEGLPPPQALAQMLAALEEQCWQFGGPDNPISWATSALARVREWLGNGMQSNSNGLTVGASNRKSRCNRALENACSHLAEEWDRKLTAAASGLMDLPGQRTALAEAAFQRLIEHLMGVSQMLAGEMRGLSERVAAAQQQLDESIQNCAGGGFRLFAWRPQRPLRVFLDRMTAFARQCLAEDTACAVNHFYVALIARLRDRLRDLSLLRQRLRQVHSILVCPPGMEAMDPLDLPPLEEGPVDDSEVHRSVDRSPTPMASLTTFWEVSRETTTARVVLPNNEADLDRAAYRFVGTLSAEHWAILDQALQDEVLSVRGGLAKAAFASNDLHRSLIVPLVDRAATCLGQYLPVTDVAQVELEAAAGDAEAIDERVRRSMELAIPMATGNTSAARPVTDRQDTKILALVGRPNSQARFGEEPAEKCGHIETWLLIPASEAGKVYGERAKELFPELHLVRVPGQADLMFCQEQAGVSASELDRIFGSCREAYLLASTVPTTSPHARFDTRDWVPLEP